MTKPYTYILEWTLSNKSYIGVRWANGCAPDDLWKKYFTSSKYVADYVNTHGAPDNIIIDMIFHDSKSALAREKELLRLHDAQRSHLFLNKNIGGCFDPSDPEIRIKMSNSHKGKSINKGRKWSDATRLKMTECRKASSEARVGEKQARTECPRCGIIGGYAAMKRWHFDNCEKKRTSCMFGKKHSDSTKEKLRAALERRRESGELFAGRRRPRVQNKQLVTTTIPVLQSTELDIYEI